MGLRKLWSISSWAPYHQRFENPALGRSLSRFIEKSLVSLIQLRQSRAGEDCFPVSWLSLFCILCCWFSFGKFFCVYVKKLFFLLKDLATVESGLVTFLLLFSHCLGCVKGRHVTLGVNLVVLVIVFLLAETSLFWVFLFILLKLAVHICKCLQQALLLFQWDFFILNLASKKILFYTSLLYFTKWDFFHVVGFCSMLLV